MIVGDTEILGGAAQVLPCTPQAASSAVLALFYGFF